MPSRGECIGVNSRWGGAPAPVKESGLHQTQPWDHEEWDVAMADGAVYRVFRECGTGGWFLEAIVD